ncbi:hypothetical protein VNI00_011161 [Paramarasmius palmivorus]|uniref:Uncharacterized protein n=1 Tax=Paramarasmius palmivorus TaxID=297713 RepID=A0AAW0CI16_9AGAR
MYAFGKDLGGGPNRDRLKRDQPKGDQEEDEDKDEDEDEEEEEEEGTENNPIPLVIPVQQFEAFCHYLLDPDKNQHGTPTSWKPDQLLSLYQASEFFQYEAAQNFARNRFSISYGLDPLNKLVFGIIHDEERWITHGLQEASLSGRMSLPTHGQNTAFTEMGCSWITGIIPHANDVYQTLLGELLDHPPQPDPDYPWRSNSCTNHQACLDAIASSWKTIRKKVPSEYCPPQGSFCLLNFRDYLVSVAFSKMNTSCRAKFIDEVADRADRLYQKFIQATVTCIMEVAKHEVEAIQRKMICARAVAPV